MNQVNKKLAGAFIGYVSGSLIVTLAIVHKYERDRVTLFASREVMKEVIHELCKHVPVEVIQKININLEFEEIIANS